jgi:iron complex outermembrane receptor protein
MTIAFRRILPSLLVLSFASAPALSAQNPPDQLAQNLKRLSIEELTQLDITTASRRIEPLSQVAAAVSVVRGEDIRRSGVTSLAEALRLADGVAVARADNETWAISTRGFNISTANKLLVLIDGRSVYSPLFAGTFWSVQDVPLANIDRIEVIHGPGGAVWGANAVNGVVNIITKSTAETKGTQGVVATGTEEHAIATVQHGGGGRGFDYRVYGKFRARDGQVLSTGVDANDDVKMGQAGFRMDSSGRGRDTWLVQGDGYVGREGLYSAVDNRVSGANLMGRWGRRFSPGAQFRAQVYVDHVYRRVYNQIRDTRNTVDVDLQQQSVLGRHALVVGGDLRVSRGEDIGNAAFHFDPVARTSTIAGVFAQDEIAVVPRRLALIVGSKFERNTFTGVEAQPSVRVRWTPVASQTLWGAVSRAVRLPTRFDTHLRFNNPATGALTLTGSNDFETEKVVAYEAGYRAEVSRLSLDLAVASQVYDELRSEEFPLPGSGGPIVLANLMDARTWSADASGTVLLLPRWRVHASYTYLHEAVSFDAGSRDLTRGVNEYNDPAHMFKLRTNVDLPGNLELDGVLRRVSLLPHPVVPAYAELDARIGWRASPSWELSLVGQNLLHAQHQEFRLASPTIEEFQRGAYVRLLWRY